MSKKEIILMGDATVVVRSFEEAICTMPTGTRASNTVEPFDDIDIHLGTIVYDFNVLESGSVVFKLNPKGESYYVTMFGIMFSPSEGDVKEKMGEIKGIDEEISALYEKRNKILETLEHCDDKEIGF